MPIDYCVNGVLRYGTKSETAQGQQTVSVEEFLTLTIHDARWMYMRPYS